VAKVVQFQYINEREAWLLDDEGDIWCRTTFADGKVVWNVLVLPIGLDIDRDDEDALS